MHKILYFFCNLFNFAEAWDQLIREQEMKDEQNSKAPGNQDKTHETVRQLKQFKAVGPEIARRLGWEVPDWERFSNAKLDKT